MLYEFFTDRQKGKAKITIKITVYPVDPNEIYEMNKRKSEPVTIGDQFMKHQ